MVAPWFLKLSESDSLDEMQNLALEVIEVTSFSRDTEQLSFNLVHFKNFPSSNKIWNNLESMRVSLVFAIIWTVVPNTRKYITKCMKAIWSALIY